jgi:hypothetical protein
MTAKHATGHLARIKELMNDIRTKDYVIRDNGTQIKKSILTGTTIDGTSRLADIEKLVLTAREAGRRAEEEIGLAAFIAEISGLWPQAALDLWDKEKDRLSKHDVYKTMCYWGLSHALGGLQRSISAAHFEAAAQNLLRGLSQEEAQECRKFANIIPHEISDWRAELQSYGALQSWLSKNRNLTIGSFGYEFGEFATNDKHFVSDAEERVRFVQQQVSWSLAKPANFLLEASPGLGKSHFVREFAKKLFGSKEDFNNGYLERNLSAYASIDEAFRDIVLDVLLALARHKPVVLFIDEVDTEIDGRHIFQKLIAPINGDLFFFLGKQLSFAKQNLVVCHALSSQRDKLKETPKWPDFLSRIPKEHRFVLPSLNSEFERVFRAMNSLIRHAKKSKEYREVSKISCQALLYLGHYPWESARELDQALEMALLRKADPNLPLDLEHVVTDAKSVLATERERGVAILGIDDFYVELRPRPKADAL